MKEELLELIIGVVVFAIIIVANLMDVFKKRGKGFNLSTLLNRNRTTPTPREEAEDNDSVLSEFDEDNQAALSEEAKAFFRQYQQENSSQFIDEKDVEVSTETAEKPAFGYADTPPSSQSAPVPSRQQPHATMSLPPISGNYAQFLRKNPRCAMVMHEIIGKPRSELWK